MSGVRAIAATLETIESRPGVHESFILIPAEGKAFASVILFTGGNGRIGLTPENIGNPFSNFLARSRQLFAAQGLQVALLDSPSDHRELDEWRVSAEHATDIAAVVRFLRAKASLPVWLVGTSRGTISTANGGARLANGPTDSRPDGIVLTSSVTIPLRGELTTVYSVDLNEIPVPVLLVHHKSDGCKVSPFGATGALARSFSKSPKVELLAFEGGDPPRSDSCQPFAPHGYLGIEDKIVSAIAAWIKANGAP